MSDRRIWILVVITIITALTILFFYLFRTYLIFDFIVLGGTIIWVLLKYRELKNTKQLSVWGWNSLIIAVLFGIWSLILIWLKIRYSILYSIIFFVFIALFVAGFSFWIYRIITTKEPQSDFTQPIFNSIEPKIESLSIDDSMVSFVRAFKPQWRFKDGKRKLEGGENGNNARLAQYLRKRLSAKIETEETIENGSRVDIIVQNEIVIECKPHLKTRDMFDSLFKETNRLKQLNGYRVYAVVYGDARPDYHHDLCQSIGEKHLILLGKILENNQ